MTGRAEYPDDGKLAGAEKRRGKKEKKLFLCVGSR